MGACQSAVPSVADNWLVSSIKIHTAAFGDKTASLPGVLKNLSDSQLIAEIQRRHLDIHESVSDELVKEHYDFGKVIGAGASGKVYLVRHKKTGKKYACKVVLRDSEINDEQSMTGEIEVMKRLRHNNVVGMHEVFQTPTCIWMIIDYAEGGDLLDRLASSSHYDEAMVAEYFKQALQGVHHLHSLGVVHRDLKLDNLLFSADNDAGEVKVADFGLSALVNLNERGYSAEGSMKRKNYKNLREMWGTKEYFAPEIYRRAYGPQADVWALGCVLYEMLTGETAFTMREDRRHDTLVGRVLLPKKDFEYKSRASWATLSPSAKDLIDRLLTENPVKRLSVSEALEHRWLNGDAKDSWVLPDAQKFLRARVERKVMRQLRKAASAAARPAMQASVSVDSLWSKSTSADSTMSTPSNVVAGSS